MEQFDYRQCLIDRFWDYQSKYLSDYSQLEQQKDDNPNRPPVFLEESVYLNILLPKSLVPDYPQAVLDQIPNNQRHKWFRSMSSSQALAQSVFGNLYALGKLNLLADLKGDNGKPLFLRSGADNVDFKMEYAIDFLNEPRKTSLDVFFGYPDYKIAVECKFTEQEVGSCSRPRISKKDTNYYRDYCNGKFVIQNGRSHCCSLSEREIKYWDYIPALLNWDAKINYEGCDLRYNYQLVRNILAACVKDEKADPNNGHAVLVYDERNPAFQAGGKGWKSYENTKQALKSKSLLQKCTWQEIINAINHDSDLNWLVKAMNDKYGIINAIS